MFQSSTSELNDLDVDELKFCDYKWLKFLLRFCIVLALISIFFGAFSLARNDWLILTPPNEEFMTNPDRIESYQRSLGLFYVCFENTTILIGQESVFGSCKYRDVGQRYKFGAEPDRNYQTIIKVRLAQIALHGVGLMLTIIVTFMSIGLTCAAHHTAEDSTSQRTTRVVLGYVLLVSAFTSLISIVLWHIGQDYDKILLSDYLLDEFPHWAMNVKRETEQSYGLGYICIWVSTFVGFGTAWCLLYTACIWCSPSPAGLMNHSGMINPAFDQGKVSELQSNRPSQITRFEMPSDSLNREHKPSTLNNSTLIPISQLAEVEEFSTAPKPHRASEDLDLATVEIDKCILNPDIAVVKKKRKATGMDSRYEGDLHDNTIFSTYSILKDLR